MAGLIDRQRKKVWVIFGTRPELIKLAPVIRVLRESTDLQPVVCSTGQHREMLRQVSAIFGIEPDLDLDLMRPNQDLTDLTSHVLVSLREAFDREKPDLVVVQGDTTTAFAAALAAFYQRIPVAHVEAGLRSYDTFNPYPEEANRRFVSAMASFHFAPTDSARMQLLAEGISADSIHLTGNTVVDALDQVRLKLDDAAMISQIQNDLAEVMPGGWIESGREYVLITLHRREKFGGPMQQVFGALASLAEEHPELDFVYPLHLNPRVMEPARERLGGIPNVYLIPPQDYLVFNYLMKHCRFVLSDSGGVQEEVYTWQKPVLVLRDVTERMEAVRAGYAFLVRSEAEAVREAFALVNARIHEGYLFFTMPNPFGDGSAALRIGRVLEEALG
jgi:UDP-N-acetylglucosamine 2-epimerase (non-hydrolysing)